MLNPEGITHSALEAFERGWQALPVKSGEKHPLQAAWVRTKWESRAACAAAFTAWEEQGITGIGLLTGASSGGLIDVDLDNINALRLRRSLLTRTPMMTGRAGRPGSHLWYVAIGDLPPFRQYKMPNGGMAVELRSDSGHQTVVPPSLHPSGERYVWEGAPWGGETGPTRLDGRKLAVDVATLALGAILLDHWPEQGGRHEAYLTLAGGLLRFGYQGVHPYWERNLPVLIEALVTATKDEDGAHARTSEVMTTTLARLAERDTPVSGWPKLAEIIGTDHAEAARRAAREVEQLAGFVGLPVVRIDSGEERTDVHWLDGEALESTLPDMVRNPLVERISSWGAVDLEPYLLGQVTRPDPSVLVREDGQGLMYPGRVNSLFGKSESAKSWLALLACMQEIAKGNRVLYIDLEDNPEGTIERMMALGLAADDINGQFRYVQPEGPLADMERNRYGPAVTKDGETAHTVFTDLVKRFDPTLIVADGMTALFGLHGHDTNDASSTEVVTGWLKRLCRAGRSTVIVIDHTGKGDGPGASPIGSHHKVAMVQGTAIRVDVIDRPMPGSIGTMQLVVFKDRPGAVRRISSKDKEQIAGIATLDSTADGGRISRLWIDPPNPGDFVVAATDASEAKLEKIGKQQTWQQRIYEVLDDAAWHLTADLPAAFGLDKDAFKPVAAEVRDAWHAMERMGILSRMGENKHTRLRLVRPAPSGPDA